MSTFLLTVFIPLALTGALPSGASQASVASPAKGASAMLATPASPRIRLAPPASAPIVAPRAMVQLVKIQQGPGPAPPAAAPALERTAILDRVAKALSEVRTAQGKFNQVDQAGKLSGGSFYINRPGKVRFEYTSPEPMFIVSDGTSVSIEEPRRKSYDAAPLSSTPLHLFLRSSIDLKRDGSATDVSSSNGLHFVTLVDTTGEAQGKMILEFRALDFELLGWRTLDGAGAETRVTLLDVKRNVPLKASLFVVRDPADAGDNRR